jgi:hypothetical protein
LKKQLADEESLKAPRNGTVDAADTIMAESDLIKAGVTLQNRQ